MLIIPSNRDVMKEYLIHDLYFIYVVKALIALNKRLFV